MTRVCVCVCVRWSDCPRFLAPADNSLGSSTKKINEKKKQKKNYIILKKDTLFILLPNPKPMSNGLVWIINLSVFFLSSSPFLRSYEILWQTFDHVELADIDGIPIGRRTRLILFFFFFLNYRLDLAHPHELQRFFFLLFLFFLYFGH